MSLPTRDLSVYTLPSLHVGYLTQENGDLLLQESGDAILLDNPTQNPNLNTRDISTISSYGTRH